MKPVAFSFAGAALAGLVPPAIDPVGSGNGTCRVLPPAGKYGMVFVEHCSDIGRDGWAVRPLAGAPYIDPAGLDADAKGMSTFNPTNNDTDGRAGNEFILYDVAGRGLGDGWVAGIGGSLYRRTADDKRAGVTMAEDGGRALPIVPSVRHDGGEGGPR